MIDSRTAVSLASIAAGLPWRSAPAMSGPQPISGRQAGTPRARSAGKLFRNGEKIHEFHASSLLTTGTRWASSTRSILPNEKAPWRQKTETQPGRV